MGKIDHEKFTRTNNKRSEVDLFTNGVGRRFVPKSHGTCLELNEQISEIDMDVCNHKYSFISTILLSKA